MMSQKRGKPDVTQGEQLSEQFSLLDLPLPALALVAEHSKTDGASGHPLLGIARGCRDTVLYQFKKISLRKAYGTQSSDVAPAARLLNRACCTAQAGLHVDLDLRGEHEDVLAQLLQPGLEQQEGGWPNVHKLTARLETSSNAHLISSAMPALRNLELTIWSRWELGPDAGFFSSLQLCTQLTALHLAGFTVSDDAAAMAAAAALARLPNLREVELEADKNSHVCPTALVKHLTALTSLRLHNNSSRSDPAPLYAAAASNPGLLSFSLHQEDEIAAPAAQLHQLLKACPSLTELDLGNTAVQQDALYELLWYGTSITSLTTASIRPDSSFAGRQVPWRKLFLVDDDYPTALHLANLPLQLITSLHMTGYPEPWLGLLTLPTSSVPAEQLPGLLLQATTNLAKCPAWHSKPESQLLLGGDSAGGPPAYASFNPAQRLQLFQALAPLGGPHVESFELNIEGIGVELGRAEVAALAQSLGKGLVELRLTHVSLAADFWAALDESLPSLHTLALGEQVLCFPMELGIFCARRPPGRQFTLELSRSLYNQCEGRNFEGDLQAQGVSHVKVRELRE